MVGVLVKAVAMGLFQVVGAVRPRSEQAFFTRDTWLNVANGLLLFALKYLIVGGAVFYSGFSLIPADALGSGPVQFLVGFLVLDFIRYWVHRADHRISWLWRFHRVHHSAETLDTSTGLRMHLVDFAQLISIPLFVFGVLLDGQAFEPWVIPAALAVGDVMDAFEHANIRMNMRHPFWRAWNTLFNCPGFHAWHHTRDGSLCNGNYSNTLVIWDRMFGSDVTRPDPPALYGLEPDQALDNSLLGWVILRRPQSASFNPDKVSACD